jgi:site-specific DNA-methyltransferase (adenine-specific)
MMPEPIVVQDERQSVDLHHADIRAWCEAYDGDLFHVAFMDAPYHLIEMTRRYGRDDAAPAQYGSDGAFQRLTRGFMGMEWDGGDVAYDLATWEGIARVMHPGAFVLTFAGGRTYHLVAMAMQLAGLVIHEPLEWLYASGKEKSTNLPAQIAARGEDDNLVEAWANHRYGHGSLAPCRELIAVGQVPYLGSAVDSIVATGAGAWNIEAGRIPSGERRHTVEDRRPQQGVVYGNGLLGSKHQGRWPKPVVLSHSSDCNEECAPDCPVRLLDEQSGPRAPGGKVNGTEPSAPTNGIYGEMQRTAFEPHPAGEGGASQFYHIADWNAETLERLAGLSFRYEPKAGVERDLGLEGFSPVQVGDGRENAIDNAYQRGQTRRYNPHPTIKPIDLCRYWLGLLLPPERYAPRRCLVPFAGTGSEMIGAMLAGWEHIVGVEWSAEYLPYARARLQFWHERRGSAEAREVARAVRKTQRVEEVSGQRRLF